MTARTVSAKAWFVQVVLVLSVAVLLAPAGAAASTFTVNTTADEHDFNSADPFCDADPGAAELCTLRAGIEQTNAQPGSDTVIVPDGTYTLDLGQLMITDDLLLDGSAASTTIVRPELIGRVLQVHAGSSELRDLTIRDGVLANVGAGIWISDEPARLTVRDSVITNNIAQGENGGGIWNIGSLVLVRTTVSDNRTLFSGRGGGIYNDDEADLLRLVESTVSGNSADSASGPDPAFGGGIFNDGGFPISGPVELERTTLSGNGVTGSAGDLGGGIYSEGALALTSSTVVANSAPVGANLFRAAGSTLASFNSILADPVGGAGCAAEAVAAPPSLPRFNLDEDGSCGLDAASGNRVGVDPLLGPLAANGGPTATHALAKSSPAIDAGSAAGATTDQRGLPRPVDVPGRPNPSEGSDIGAFELQLGCKGEPATIIAGDGRTRGTGRGDVIVGRPGKDVIKASGGRDLVCAGAGNDKVLGSGGKDTLVGQGGKDKLRGGGGKDKLAGGGKSDHLDGGGGSDSCEGGGGSDELKNCERP